jgi:hypothetical protein
MSVNCENLKSLVQGFSLVQACDVIESGALRIATPFHYPNGSQIDLFLEMPRGLFQQYELTDYGQTADYLMDMQIKPWATSKRRTLIKDVCQALGVNQEGGKFGLTIQPSQMEDFSSSLVRLAQACIRIADLSFTQRLQMTGAFQENVEEFFSDANLSYETDVALTGQFGNVVKVDFGVHGKRVNSLVQILSTPTTTNSHARSIEVFRRWYDLAPHKEQNQFVTLFDSSRDVYKPDDLERLQTVSTVLGFPEEQGEILETVAA